MLAEVFATYSQVGGILTDGGGVCPPQELGGRWGQDLSDTHFPIDTEHQPPLCPQKPMLLGGWESFL